MKYKRRSSNKTHSVSFVFSKEIMLPIRNVIVFLAIIALCYCDTEARARKKHHYKHLFFHEYHYLIFLALKFKVILVLGTIWAFSMLFGKAFAAIKLAEYMRKNYYHHDDHHEVYPPHHGSFDYPGVYGKSYPSFPSIETFQHHSEVSDSGPPTNAYGSDAPEQVYDSSSSYGRSETDNSGIYENLSAFSRIIRKLDVSEIAFRDMHLGSDECKRKFVCEAEFNVKQSAILSTAYQLFSDDSYKKYKTNQTITTIDDCAKLYPTCQEEVTW